MLQKLSLITQNIDKLIKTALEEDIGGGDITSQACFTSSENVEAYIVAKETGVVCGLEIAKRVFHRVDSSLQVEIYSDEGETVSLKKKVMSLKGKPASIFSAERVALNFLQHLSGIASQVSQMNDRIHPHTKLLDTRKTLPGLRYIQKYAVEIGGGKNHRMGLHDMFMLKENHISACGGIKNALERVDTYKSEQNISAETIIEVETLDELEEVIEFGKRRVRRVLLDNFEIETLKKAIERAKPYFETEASGGINEANIHLYSDIPLDYISLGCLTHTTKAMDFSLLTENAL